MDIRVKLYTDESKKKVAKKIYCNNIHYAHFTYDTDEDALTQNGLDDMNEYLVVEQEDSTLLFFPLSKIRYEIYGIGTTDKENRKEIKWLRREIIDVWGFD